MCGSLTVSSLPTTALQTELSDSVNLESLIGKGVVEHLEIGSLSLKNRGQVVSICTTVCGVLLSQGQFGLLASLKRYRPDSSCQWFDVISTKHREKSSDGFFRRVLQTETTKPMNYLTIPKAKEFDTMDSDKASICSICETNRESIASDLTRMCVSDEEQPVST